MKMDETSKKEFIERLRDFADRLENCQDDLPYCDIRIGFYRIQEADQLRTVAKISDAKTEIRQEKSRGHHWIKCTIAGFDTAAHFNPDILGMAEEKKTVVRRRYKQTVKDLLTSNGQ